MIRAINHSSSSKFFSKRKINIGSYSCVTSSLSLPTDNRNNSDDRYQNQNVTHVHDVGISSSSSSRRLNSNSCGSSLLVSSFTSSPLFDSRRSYSSTSSLSTGINILNSKTSTKTLCDAPQQQQTAQSSETFYSGGPDSNHTNDLVSETASSITSDLSSDPTTSTIEAVGDMVFDPTWYNPGDQALVFLNWIHTDMLGGQYPYVYSIIGTTLFARAFLFPFFVYAQRNTSRMAHATPEMKQIQEKIDHLKKRGNVDPEIIQMEGQKIANLLARYDCNPLKSLVAPLVSMPIFMSMFFGLRKAPEFFSDTYLIDGGVFWFMDLSVPDPYYVLPVMSSLTLLAMLEFGQNSMTLTQTETERKRWLYIFRGLSVIMIPLTAWFPSAVLTYWVTNNTASASQTLMFQSPSVRKALGIWDPPKQAVLPPKKKKKGDDESEGVYGMVTDIVDGFMGNKPDEKEKSELKKSIERHNERVMNKNAERLASKRGGGGNKKKKRRRR